jgi:hypothetical protein
LRAALRRLSEMFGTEPAESFGPKRFIDLRAAMVEGRKRADLEKSRRVAEQVG